MEAPIFVVGANRSGTTLLRLILNAHSRIGIPEETEYIDRCLGGVPSPRWDRFPGTRDEYERFVNGFLARSHEHVFPELEADQLREAIMASGRVDCRTPYQHLMEAWAGYHEKARWGEKTPSNLFYVDVILGMFPGAQFIHLVRDPRAGVHSMMNTRMFRGDVVFNALNRRKYLDEGFDFLRRHVPADQWMTLRYEDLVARPDEQVAALCDFLGESFEPGMLHFYQDSSRYMKAEAAATFNEAATKPISKAKKDRWREEMRPEDIAKVENVCAREMRVFGYASEEVPLTPRARLEIAAKTTYWQAQVWRNRHVRHYIVQYTMFERSRQRLQQLFEPAA